MTALRLLSWNVRDLLGDPPAVARIIASAEPDLVCLQEAPRWPGSRWRLAALARQTDLLFAAGGRAAAGCALLTAMRVDVVTVRSRRLPVEGRLTRPRGWVLARVRVPGGASAVLATVHLGLTAPERADHVARIVAGIDELRRPGEGVLVAGDLNEPPGSPSWDGLGAVVVDPAPGAGPTFPAAAPARRIDAVLAGPPSDPIGVELVPDDVWAPDPADLRLASDHRPVLARLTPRAPSSP